MKGPTWAGRVEDPASANSQAELVLIHFFPKESLILEGIKLAFNRETENIEVCQLATESFSCKSPDMHLALFNMY